jgi:hypothetical protein
MNIFLILIQDIYKWVSGGSIGLLRYARNDLHFSWVFLCQVRTRLHCCHCECSKATSFPDTHPFALLSLRAQRSNPLILSRNIDKFFIRDKFLSLSKYFQK